MGAYDSYTPYNHSKAKSVTIRYPHHGMQQVGWRFATRTTVSVLLKRHEVSEIYPTQPKNR